MQNIQMQGEENLGFNANFQNQQNNLSQAQQNQFTYVDYPKLLQTAMPVASENKDLANFAYYLYRTDLVKPHPQAEDDWESLRMRVNFCDCAHLKPVSKLMNFSRLEQLYTTDIFSDDYYTTLWKKKEHFPDAVCDGCKYCTAADSRIYPMCPYWLCHVVVKAAEAYKIEPEVIFNDMLGDQKMSFYGRDVKKLSVQIPDELFEGIDSKSAHGAYMLIISDLVRIGEKNGDVINYTHVPLCKGDDKSSKIDTIISFWKTGSGVYDRIDLSDKKGIIGTKTGCRKCNFAQCPHKLAAYFMHLAEIYGVTAPDLAYYVANKNTYAEISVGANFQFNKYLTMIRKSCMNAQSKEELIKIIHYIVGRSKNSRIPFLPFNTAIASPDRENASEVVDIIVNALWYFDYYFGGRDAIKTSEIFMSSTSVTRLVEMYEQNYKYANFIIYDVRLLCDNKEFQAVCHRVLKLMEDGKRNGTTILVGEKDEIAYFFQCYPEFKTKIFTKTLELSDMDNRSVHDELVDKLTETFTIPEEVDGRLEQYVQLAYPASPLRNKAFVNDVYEKILFNHYNHDVNADSVMTAADIPYITPPRSEDEIFEEINRLTGLENVKRELKSVNDLVKFNIKMGSANKNAVNLHMVFTGNPGTGKTTVARLTAEILHSIGFIQENKLVVCSAKDLIGEYLGMTAPQTAKKCEEAYNGVLFIDEAYQLNPYTSNKADVYKEECIAELIQQMENNRDRLVVIFAGYTDEMNDFLNRANTGLRSRIGKIIDFPDYTADELLDIFTKIVERNGMHLGEGAANKATFIFNNALQDTQRFGNARFARNLYERSLMQHAAITANLDKDDPALRTLQSDEITHPNN